VQGKPDNYRQRPFFWRRANGGVATFAKHKATARVSKLILMGQRERKKGVKAAAAAASSEGCDIIGCGKPIKRHLAPGKVSAALPNERIRPDARSVGLCHDHYREFKKATKEERDLDRASWEA